MRGPPPIVAGGCRINAVTSGEWMTQSLLEILVFLFILACLTLGGSSVLEGWRRVRRRPGLGRGYWGALLGGLALLFLLLVLLTRSGALTVGLTR
jgi:hypothetical protein